MLYHPAASAERLLGFLRLGATMRYRLLSLFCAFGFFAGDGFADDADKIAFFEAKIRPVLVENCLKCHGETKHNAKLRLDSKAALLKGGVSGPAIVPGKAKDSLLIKAIRHVDPELKMPAKEKKLPEAVIVDFEKWIDMGAPDPRDRVPKQSLGTRQAEASSIDWKAARQFWSIQPLKKTELPQVQNSIWAKTPIDRFILARLEREKLQPVRAATKRELIRRASFDLTGLPPTPYEVEAFLKDDAPNAFEKVIDRLLQSPHYGERWGRYWLDVARYAEDQAHTFAVVPNTNAWRYRDWVIAALNEDMPYDRFVKLQIAADLIEMDDAGRIKNLPALGFFGLGAQYYKNTDAAKAAADELDDRVDTLTRGFLGLTVSCARCHDHKFDPIPQQDYYSLAGIFSSCKISNVQLASQDLLDKVQKHQDLIRKVDGDVKAFVRAEKTELAERFQNDVARYLLSTWRYQIQKKTQPAWSINQQAKKDNVETYYLTRCVEYLKKPPAATGLINFKRLTPEDEDKAVAFAVSFERKAQEVIALRDKKQPLDKTQSDILTGFFGDAGVFAPTDTELKTKLSVEKSKRWEEMKAQLAKVQKEDISKTLPIAHGLAETTPANLKVFLRGNPAKLGEEAPRRFLRILAGDEPKPFTQGSGRLELADALASKDNPLTARVMVNRVWQYHFGRPIVGTPSNFGQLGDRPTHPELLDYLACRFMETGWSMKKLHREIMLSAVYQLSSDQNEKNFAIDGDNRWLWRMNRRRLDVESWRDAMLAVSGKLDARLGGPTTNLAAVDNNRRTVYAKISRHDLNYVLRLFDFPDANITSERRNETTVPQQQLFVLNSPFVIETAKALAARVQKEASSDAERVQRAFTLTYGRPASAEETRIFVSFLQGQDTEPMANRLTRWERVAQILIGSNEFMYVD
jgi:hypothetical protein